MKRFYTRFRMLLLTFAFGLASVNFVNWLTVYRSEISVNLPQVESSSVFEIITKRKWSGFEFFGHGCGGRNSYGGESSVSVYQANDFRTVSTSSSSHDNAKQARQEIELRIKDALKVIEFTKFFIKKSKIIQKRIVLENEKNENKWIDILKYDDGKSLEIINAPTLELALEFEKWQKTRKR